MGRVIKALQNPAIIGVLLGLLLLYNGCFVLAASGGAMGGSFFDDYSPGSSSSSDYSYQSYSTLTTAQKLSDSDPNHVPRQSGDGDPSVNFPLLIILVVFCVVAVVCLFIIAIEKTVTAADKTSVIKLQVGLCGAARSVQAELTRIAEGADTSSRKGVSNMLQETIQALLGHPDCCISGYSSMDVMMGAVEVQKRFDKLSFEERSKFDEETVINIDNIRKQTAITQRTFDFHNEYIVVTIIVAAEGVDKLPPINSRANLKEALQKLSTIPLSKFKASHVLWTPQNENDTLTKQEYDEKYSQLTPL